MDKSNTKIPVLPPPPCEAKEREREIFHVLLLPALFSSLPEGVEETRETREKMGIMVHYTVKVRCVISFGK